MTTSFLDRPTDRLAYELTGDPNGPLVVLSPGMGDLRSTFDGLAERLAAEGAQVVNADLRGHGESSTGWDAYGVSAVADDLLALLHAHGGRGVLVGNSYSGSAAVIAAARQPEAVSGLVLLGAFVRDGKESVLQKALFALFHRAFPGLPYLMLHSFSHLLITAVSLECGYPASSIRERIYALPNTGYGVLLYTGSPDAEGTLGGGAGQRPRHSSR